eukprot:scaffold15.g4359.t1
MLGLSRLAGQASRLLSSQPAVADQALAAGAAACSRAFSQWGASRSFAADASETISVTFYDDKDGSTKTVQAPLGKSILEVAHDNDVELEGACEGSLACSTCHVIVEDQDYYDRLPEPDDDENDMLDLAFGLTDTSRLGCQIKCTPDLDGLRLRIPSATRNMAVDGYRPKPH